MAVRFRVVVTDDRYGAYAEEQAVLGEIGAELAVKDFKSEDEAIAGLREADGVLVNLFPMTPKVIQSLQKCRVLSRYGVGYDNVDVAAATARRIWVARVPDYSIEDVSDQALALLLACVRGIAYKDRGVRAGRWNMHKDVSTRRVAGKTLGLVGYGAIARCLHRKVSGFGLARVLVHDPYVDAATLKRAGAEPAGLDVFETEPLPADSPLRALENVVLSDHAGWYSEESVPELKTKAARNVAAVLSGGTPVYPVNTIQD